MDKQANDIIKVHAPIPVVAGFNWSVGVLMEKFLNELADKKLLAVKCPGCGYVHVPPRRRCVKCHAKMGESDLVELSGKGELAGWTAAHVELDGKGNWRDLEEPKVIGAIKLEGADSLIYIPVAGVKPEDVEPGMKVVPGWADELKGEPGDLSCFKPAK